VREQLLWRGVLLAWATVGWNAIEGVIAVSAGLVASSVALIGFGIDSFVETASGAVVGWRLWAEFSGRYDEERAEAAGCAPLNVDRICHQTARLNKRRVATRLPGPGRGAILRPRVLPRRHHGGLFRSARRGKLIFGLAS